jgi:hypothetical protein
MGVVLMPKNGAEGFDASFWAWRPLVNLLQESPGAGLGTDWFLAEVGEEQAARIADFLDGFLQRQGAEWRLLLDGSITGVPDTGEFYLDPADSHKNYSASRQWLTDFRDFCRRSGGFNIN